MRRVYYICQLKSLNGWVHATGGVREAYKGKGEEYRIFWPDRAEFVRMAARYGATIVPFAGVGCEDSVNMLLDPQQAWHT